MPTLFRIAPGVIVTARRVGGRPLRVAARSLCPRVASVGRVPARATTPAVSSCGRSSAVAALAAGPTFAPVGALQNGGA